MLSKDLRGRDSTIDATQAEQFFGSMKREKEIYKSNDLVGMVNELEQIFSDKLPLDQVTRIMKLFRIFEGTPTTIKNGLVKGKFKFNIKNIISHDYF